jgi:hypothetical protein
VNTSLLSNSSNNEKDEIPINEEEEELLDDTLFLTFVCDCNVNVQLVKNLSNEIKETCIKLF